VCKLFKVKGGASPDVLARPSLPLPDANLTPWLDPPFLPLLQLFFEQPQSITITQSMEVVKETYQCVTQLYANITM